MENNVISPSLIFIDEEIQDKKDIINFIAKNAKDGGYLSDSTEFVKSVMDREEEFSTAMGNDIAIPHGKSDAVKFPFIAFFRSKNRFAWNEDDEKVRIIFQIGVPKIGTELLHLKLISELSKKLLDENFIKVFTESNSKDEIYDLFRSVEV